MYLIKKIKFSLINLSKILYLKKRNKRFNRREKEFLSVTTSDDGQHIKVCTYSLHLHDQCL